LKFAQTSPPFAFIGFYPYLSKDKIYKLLISTFQHGDFDFASKLDVRNEKRANSSDFPRGLPPLWRACDDPARRFRWGRRQAPMGSQRSCTFPKKPTHASLKIGLEIWWKQHVAAGLSRGRQPSARCAYFAFRQAKVVKATLRLGWCSESTLVES
jgi:hypothetical protein